MSNVWIWLWLGCAAEVAPPASAPARVEVVTAVDGVLDASFTYLGEVRALDAAWLSAGAAGAVDWVSVREGDPVVRGAGLLVVDDGVPSAELQAADAAVAEWAASRDLAAQSLERTLRVRDGVLSPFEREQAEADLAVAEAKLRGAKAQRARAAANLALYRVDAPFDGVVAERRVSPGDYVRAGDPVIRLVSNADVEVHVDVGRELVGRLPIGTKVLVNGREDLPAVVVGAVPALDSEARTARVRVGLQAPSPDLVPGLTVDVSFSIPAAPTGVVVPRDALVLTAGDPRVVKVVDGAAVASPVTVLARAGDRVMLSSGVVAGDVVVVRGNERLAPGAKVEVIP
jgi:RND family efflux transporter MFP subunit